MNFVSQGKVFDNVSVGASEVKISEPVSTEANLNEIGVKNVYIYSTKAGTLDIEIKLEPDGDWYTLKSSETISATTLYTFETSLLFYAIRLIYTNGSAAGVLNGWIFSAT
jgi:hypothetical protein